VFHAEIFEESDIGEHGLFGIAIASCVLHNLNGAEAEIPFRLMRRVLMPGGRVVTRDPVCIENQNPIARLLASLERGLNLRTPDGYRGLTRGILETGVGEVIHIASLPHTRFILIPK
jgi:hypothetical protein